MQTSYGPAKPVRPSPFSKRRSPGPSNSHATLHVSAEQANYAPCAWGVFKGDRIRVPAKPGRCYVTAYRDKDRVSVALDKKGVAKLLEIPGAASLQDRAAPGQASGQYAPAPSIV